MSKKFEEEIEEKFEKLFDKDFEKKFEKFFETKFKKNYGGFHMGCGIKPSVFGIIIGLFVLTYGIIWLGNDLKWWELNFPFWPAIIISIGALLFLSEIKKFFIK
jgi:hypothetical protein